jgi:hypothetical protein
MSPLKEIGGKRLPILRWSVLRMALSSRRLMKDWQVGDGTCSRTPAPATSTT